MSTWRFDALAGAALEAESGSVPLERKAAALLLILYRSGPTPRSRLAGMLWPGSPEGTARNNLAQALRRLRVATGAEIVVGDARLELVPDLRCDLAASVGDDTLDVLGSRALLAAHDYDDCAELAEWLELERQRLLRRHLAHLHDEAEGLEAMGNARAALRAYERIVALEPTDEAAHRGAMRARHALGDRAGALRAAARCRDTLARLGLVPHRDTVALTRSIAAAADGAPGTRRDAAAGSVDAAQRARESRDGDAEPVAVELGESAQRLAWIAAVAGPEFSAPLAERLLGVDAFGLVAPWRDLEDAGIVVDGRFASGARCEAVVASLPATVRPALHRLVAAALEADGAEATVVARHHLAAGDRRRAAEAFRAAAQDAERAYRYQEAVAAYDEAARCFELVGSASDAFATAEAAVTLRFVAGVGGLETGVATLARFACSPDEKARAHRAEAELHCRMGRLVDAEREALAACGWAEQGCEVGAVLDTLNTLAGTYVEQGRPRDAAAWLERAVALCRLHDAPELATALNNLALVEQSLGAAHRALARHAEAFALSRERGRWVTALAAINNQARAQLALGRPEAAEALLQRSLELAGTMPDAVRFRVAAVGLHGAAAAHQGRFDDALTALAASIELAQAHDVPSGEARLALAGVLWAVGAEEEAREALAPLCRASGPQQLAAMLAAAAWSDDADDARAWLDRVRERPGLDQQFAARHRYLRITATLDPEGVPAVRTALREAVAARLPPVIVADALCLVRCAVVAGDADAARTAWLAAERAGAAVTSQLVHAELRRVRGLLGTPDGDARRARQQRSFRAWLRRSAGRVPVAYRDRYLGLAQRPTRDPGTL